MIVFTELLFENVVKIIVVRHVCITFRHFERR